MPLQFIYIRSLGWQIMISISIKINVTSCFAGILSGERHVHTSSFYVSITIANRYVVLFSKWNKVTYKS